MDATILLAISSLIISILMLIIILLLKPSEQQPTRALSPQYSGLVTVKQCGNKINQSEYREGEYVGMRVNDCIIIGIYRVGTESSSPR